ncbi:TPA: hypothetical protein ACH3X1_015060 [Trebouxia sp. C0004]
MPVKLADSQSYAQAHSCLPDRSRLPVQVHSLLRLWRHQETQRSRRFRNRKDFRKQEQKQAATQHAHLARATHNKRSPAVHCASSTSEESSVVAGIPVSSANTTAGHSLWQTLQHKQLDFVPEVQKCLHELAAQSTEMQGVQQEGVLVSTRRKALLEDILYYWAVAEAYLADASIQASFRQALGRTGTTLLAQGSDGIRLQSQVQLLDEQEGQYMIGSVQFAKPGEALQRGASSAQVDLQPGVSSRPSLDSVLGSVRGQALLDSQGSLPSRMSREGAARTYHMYTYWGYFNRRMSARRQLEQKTMPGSNESAGIAFGDNSKQQTSYYGEMTNVWRYFENVPDAISDLRTKEAAQVADRHLRALFGDQEECLTTLLAWQQMTNEARWFGRALYDAEEIVLQSCRHHMTEQ